MGSELPAPYNTKYLPDILQVVLTLETAVPRGEHDIQCGMGTGLRHAPKASIPCVHRASQGFTGRESRDLVTMVVLGMHLPLPFHFAALVLCHVAVLSMWPPNACCSMQSNMCHPHLP